MLFSKSANPIAAINIRYVQSRRKARAYIIETLCWSERTYYRKMLQREALTERENEVIVNAYKQFIHEPFLRLLTTTTA